MNNNDKKIKVMCKQLQKISLLLGLGFIISTPLLNAQYSEKDEGLVTRYKPSIGWFFSGKKSNNENNVRKYDRLMIDLVYNDWQGDKDMFNSPATSIGYNISLMKNSILNKKGTVSLGWGLGYSRYNNRTNTPLFIYEGNNMPIGEQGITSFAENTSETSTEKWSFHANYIELPLEMRFRTKGYNHVKFMIGGKIGYQFNAHRRLAYTSQNGNEYVNKLYNFPDNNRLRYGVTARVGIRNWALFAAYHFSPLFTHDESVSLTPLSLGLTISLF